MGLMRKDVVATVCQAVIALVLACGAIGSLVLHFTALAGDLKAQQNEVVSVRENVHKLSTDYHQLSTDVHRLGEDVKALAEGQGKLLELLKSVRDQRKDPAAKPKPDKEEDKQ